MDAPNFRQRKALDFAERSFGYQLLVCDDQKVLARLQKCIVHDRQNRIRVNSVAADFQNRRYFCDLDRRGDVDRFGQTMTLGDRMQRRKVCPVVRPTESIVPWRCWS